MLPEWVRPATSGETTGGMSESIHQRDKQTGHCQRNLSRHRAKCSAGWSGKRAKGVRTPPPRGGPGSGNGKPCGRRKIQTSPARAAWLGAQFDPSTTRGERTEPSNTWSVNLPEFRSLRSPIITQLGNASETTREWFRMSPVERVRFQIGSFPIETDKHLGAVSRHFRVGVFVVFGVVFVHQRGRTDFLRSTSVANQAY